MQINFVASEIWEWERNRGLVKSRLLDLGGPSLGVDGGNMPDLTVDNFARIGQWLVAIQCTLMRVSLVRREA